MIKMSLGDVVEFGRFPNKEIYPSLKTEITIANSKYKSFTWVFDSSTIYEDLFKLELISWMCNLFEYNLEITFLPFSRSDKSNERPVCMLNLIADKINNLRFESVWIVEPHSESSLLLIENSKPVELTEHLFTKYSNFNREHNNMIVFPDAGAMKRYSKTSCFNNLPRICCFKERDSDGTIVKFDIFGDTERLSEVNKFVIVDNLCSRGGTFLEIIKRIGYDRKYDLVVAHLEDNVFGGELLQVPNLRIVTTDSIIRTSSHPKIVVDDIFINPPKIPV